VIDIICSAIRFFFLISRKKRAHPNCAIAKPLTISLAHLISSHHRHSNVHLLHSFAFGVFHHEHKTINQQKNKRAKEEKEAKTPDLFS
jgi:hypothetical protein